jgi:hydrogenase maturation protease
MKTLILGLGNPIRGDDAAGWVAAQKVFETLKVPGLSLELASVGGVHLLPLLAGYDHAIILDAAETGEYETGTLFRVIIENDDEKSPSCTMHQIDILQALDIGMKLEMDMPGKLSLYGIEVENCRDYSEELSPRVLEAIPQIVYKICSEEFGQGGIHGIEIMSLQIGDARYARLPGRARSG